MVERLGAQPEVGGADVRGRAVPHGDPHGDPRGDRGYVKAEDRQGLLNRLRRIEGQVRGSLDFPAAGRYRLFLRFVHGGRERTAGFTVEVGR